MAKNHCKSDKKTVKIVKKKIRIKIKEIIKK